MIPAPNPQAAIEVSPVAKLEVLSIPVFYGMMGLEYAHHRRRAAQGITTDGDYEWHDTLTSLTMGGLSLVMPYVWPKFVRPITPGKGKYAKYLIGGTVAAVAATSVADAIMRRDQTAESSESAADDQPLDTTPPANRRTRRHRIARGMARVGGVASIAGGVVTATAVWNDLIRSDRMWRNRVVKDLGTGVVAWSVAMVGWDLAYYLNHRMWHATRFMWANHVMHHSSEHYNLSTALRQAVTDPFLIPVPYSALSLFGVRPELVATSRSINLLYQYWVHTDAIDRMGPFEEFANTPSHHRVHHGSDKRYIDRNHGGILIIFDRLLGTFIREDATPTYGLTKNIKSFNPLRVATHEYADILRDVANADNWRDRLSFTFRGPGWAYERHREQSAQLAPTPAASAPATP